MNAEATTQEKVPASIEHAIDAQRVRLFDAQAIIEVTIAGLRNHFGNDWPGGVPMFDRALASARELINSVAGELETACLEQAVANESTDE